MQPRNGWMRKEKPSLPPLLIPQRKPWLQLKWTEETGASLQSHSADKENVSEHMPVRGLSGEEREEKTNPILIPKLTI